MTKQEILESHGFYVGKRDPKRNKAFRGKWMVCADVNEGPSMDAGDGGFCIVGDNLQALIQEALEHNEIAY